MSGAYGPWASSLGDAGLSTFWRRRMGRLASARAGGTGLNRRDWLKLGAAGAAALALPTLRPATGRDDEGREGRIYAQVLMEVAGVPDGKVQGLIAVDPETGAWSKLLDDPMTFRVSRDGRSLAYGKYGPPVDQYVKPVALWRLDLAEGGKPRKIADVGGTPCWSPDGERIIVAHQPGEPNKDLRKWETWRIEADGSGREKLPIADDFVVADWSPDGRWLVALTQRHWDESSGWQLYLMRPDGSEPRRITHGKGSNVYPRFLPDGRAVACHHATPPTRQIHRIDLKGGEPRVVFEGQGLKLPDHFAWSPDGHRLVVSVEDWERDAEGNRVIKDRHKADTRLIVMDAEGKEPRRLELPGLTFVGELDWA